MFRRCPLVLAFACFVPAAATEPPNVIVLLADDLGHGSWKFVAAAKEPAHDELYHVHDDPAETENVIAAHPRVAEQLRRRLADARDRGFTRPGAGRPPR